MRLTKFPASRIISDREKRILQLVKDLGPVVDELAWRLRAYSRQHQSDELLAGASASIAFANVSVQDKPVLFGNVVLSPMIAYWETAPLLSALYEQRVRDIGDPDLMRYLDTALQLDAEIRKLATSSSAEMD